MFTLFITKVEYMAVNAAAKEALLVKALIKELSIKQDRIQLHCDSQSAIYLAKNQVYHARTKYIDERFHKILEKVHTSDNTIDMLTTPTPTDKFKHCLDLINVSQC